LLFDNEQVDKSEACVANVELLDVHGRICRGVRDCIRSSSSTSTRGYAPLYRSRLIRVAAFDCIFFFAAGTVANFWTTVRTPGAISTYFAVFFGFAAFISLLAHALLAYESDVRWLATMALMIAGIFILVLSLTGLGLAYINVFISEGVALAGYIMFFTFVATVGRTGPIWLILQIVIFLAYVIAYGAGNAQFHSKGGENAALLGLPWEQTLFYTYYSLGGILRIGALVHCMRNRAITRQDSIAYWVVIAFNTGMYFASFAAKPILLRGTLPSLDDAQLILQLSTLTQYSLTPLLLVHIEALNHATARSQQQQMEYATRQLAIANSAADARREFIRYVFHEVCAYLC
jgi:hypothetical protein